MNSVPTQVGWSGRGHTYTEDDVAAVVAAMREADPQTQGRFQAEFERRFQDYLDSGQCFAVSSATAALELAALLCRLGPGDEVVLPAHTFAASAIPFARTGARLLWADIDPATRLVTADTIGKLITPRTRVLVVVHLYGQVCDMDPILELAAHHEIKVVEDAAQSLGARYRGRQSGTMADFGCFSFHSHKNMTTLGEGGMLAVRDPALAALVPGLRHNGMRAFPGDRPKYWVPAMSNVDFDIDGLWPYNFCLGEVQCALGIQLLGRLDRMNADRRARHDQFRTALSDFPELVFQSLAEGCESSHHLLAARYDGTPAGGTRDDLISLLFHSYGIKTVVQYCPLYRYPLFAKAGFGAADCPETDRFFDNMVSFPFHHWQSEDEMAAMIAATRDAMIHLRKGA